ncbi:kinase-like domain-containing protein [Dichotomocladium elegans]|nr:kinase-like domain-containing protein [Dichotomocladium elegans]
MSADSIQYPLATEFESQYESHQPSSIPLSGELASTGALSEPNENGTSKTLPRRQQASLGLGIITTNLDVTEDHLPSTGRTKTDAFFNATVSVPRPPPSLSARRNTITPSPASPAMIATTGRSHLAEADEEPMNGSFASRLRNLVKNNAYASSAVPAPSPIPNNYVKDSNSGVIVAGSSAERFFSDDEIMPLPSPAPGLSISSSPTLRPLSIRSQHHRHPVTPPQLSPVTPDTTEAHSPPSPSSTSIPVICSITPKKNNRIPTLLEDPLLGDIDDYSPKLPQNLNVPIARECRLPSPLKITEMDVIGKEIGSYKIGKMLGVGAFSKVYLATHMETGIEYAIKMINKARIANDPRVKSSIEREVAVLKFVDHPSIVQLEATMETDQHICIVMQYAHGEELFDFVQRMHCRDTTQRVDEGIIKRIFIELVQVIQWMHEHNIIHRDLKLENILIDMDENQQPRVKVTDFGLARVIDPASPILTTRCGSEEYAAPEIVQSLGYDGRLTDTWALGVILYALLIGYLPFTYNPARGERASHLFYRIVSANYKWPSSWHQHPELAISNEAKEVVERILKRQPDKRIALTDIPKLAWFADCS